MSSEASAWRRVHEPSYTIFPSLRRRLLASIGVAGGGLIFIMLYLAFLASRFAWYQSLAVVLSVLVAVPAILLGIWISWGLGLARHFGTMDFD